MKVKDIYIRSYNIPKKVSPHNVKGTSSISNTRELQNLEVAIKHFAPPCYYEVSHCKYITSVHCSLLYLERLLKKTNDYLIGNVQLSRSKKNKLEEDKNVQDIMNLLVNRRVLSKDNIDSQLKFTPYEAPKIVFTCESISSVINSYEPIMLTFITRRNEKNIVSSCYLYESSIKYRSIKISIALGKLNIDIVSSELNDVWLKTTESNYLDIESVKIIVQGYDNALELPFKANPYPSWKMKVENIVNNKDISEREKQEDLYELLSSLREALIEEINEVRQASKKITFIPRAFKDNASALAFVKSMTSNPDKNLFNMLVSQGNVRKQSIVNIVKEAI